METINLVLVHDIYYALEFENDKLISVNPEQCLGVISSDHKVREEDIYTDGEEDFIVFEDKVVEHDYRNFNDAIMPGDYVFAHGGNVYIYRCGEDEYCLVDGDYDSIAICSKVQAIGCIEGCVSEYVCDKLIDNKQKELCVSKLTEYINAIDSL